MNRFERVSKLYKLIEFAGGKIYTRKKLHKLIYLLQEIGDNFDQNYIYYNFGVFSPTLSADVKYACSEEIEILKEEHNDSDGYIYKIYQNGDNFSLPPQTLNIKSKEIIEALKSEEPRLLEVLSTIVYLQRNFFSGERLNQRLNDLKGEHKEFFKRAFELAKEYYDIEV